VVNRSGRSFVPRRYKLARRSEGSRVKTLDTRVVIRRYYIVENNSTFGNLNIVTAIRSILGSIRV
jgi:hypothetical protein